MKLFTKAIEQKLKSVSYSNMRPICKLFTPDGNGTWLITHWDVETNILYGYGDLGHGCVEFGSLFTVEEISNLRGKLGLPVERDKFFKDDPTINWLEKTSLSGC